MGASIISSGCEQADWFTKEIEESYRGVWRRLRD